MKKKYTGREWSENRLSRFQIGIIVALLFVIYAFNYESDVIAVDYHLEAYSETEIDQLVEVFIATPPKAKTISITKPLESIKIEEPVVEIFKPELVSNEIPISEYPTENSSNYVQEEAVRMPLPADNTLQVDEIVSDKVVSIAERMPLFEECTETYPDYASQLACTTKKLMQHIQKNLRYPSIARENGIEETVIASFIIGHNGEITDINIEREVKLGFDKSVIDAIKKVPEMLPGEQNKHKVRVKLYVPVKFKLQI